MKLFLLNAVALAVVATSTSSVYAIEADEPYVISATETVSLSSMYSYNAVACYLLSFPHLIICYYFFVIVIIFYPNRTKSCWPTFKIVALEVKGLERAQFETFTMMIVPTCWIKASIMM